MTLGLDTSTIARRQLQVVLILDCSGSMRGDRIASLSYALLTALPDLRAAAYDNPEVDVRVRVLAFGASAQWLTDGAVPVDELVWPDLTADGHTAMGAALRMVAEMLSDPSPPARQLPPVLVLASDGFPTDDVDEGLHALFATPEGNAAIRIAIAIGSDAGMPILNRFIGNPAMPPLSAGNAAELAQHVTWATTSPVKVASSPLNTADPVAALARTRPLDVSPVSDIIW